MSIVPMLLVPSGLLLSAVVVKAYVFIDAHGVVHGYDSGGILLALLVLAPPFLVFAALGGIIVAFIDILEKRLL